MELTSFIGTNKHLQNSTTLKEGNFFIGLITSFPRKLYINIFLTF